MVAVFQDICNTKVEPDGLRYDTGSVKSTPIRGEQEYQRQRIDVGFGDTVTPRAKKIEYPTILDFPAPRIRAYPRETVVAEKLHCLVVMGIANSRMKHFYDLYVLARDFVFEGDSLSRAIKATFTRRGTTLPAGIPLALTNEFGRDNIKMTQWAAFIRKGGLEKKAPGLPTVLTYLRKFLISPLKAAPGTEDCRR